MESWTVLGMRKTIPVRCLRIASVVWFSLNVGKARNTSRVSQFLNVGFLIASTMLK